MIHKSHYTLRSMKEQWEAKRDWRDRQTTLRIEGGQPEKEKKMDTTKEKRASYKTIIFIMFDSFHPEDCFIFHEPVLSFFDKVITRVKILDRTLTLAYLIFAMLLAENIKLILDSIASHVLLFSGLTGS